MALKIVGSSPTTHPLYPVTFFQKNKIKKRIFKKKHHLIGQIPFWKFSGFKKRVLKNLLYNNLYDRYFNNNTKINKNTNNTTLNKRESIITAITLTQKFNNPKGVIFRKKNLNTFSVGSIIKYFKVKHSKSLRRSSRGLNIFINFLKNIFDKKYSLNLGKNFNTDLSCLIVNICGFDYNLLQSRRNLKQLFKKNTFKQIYCLYNLKISFTKKKSKKIKSIKKRLKKKIILNFLKKVNV